MVATSVWNMNDPKSGHAASGRPLKVCLHVAIPTVKENLPLPLSAKARLKRLAVQVRDWCAWSWNRSFLFRSSHYARTSYSNRGDIAIKLAIRELLQDSFAGHAVEFIETEWGRLDAAQLQHIQKDVDLFVIAGGGYWVFNRDRKLSPVFLADLPFMLSMPCPLVVFGAGVNFNLPEGATRMEGTIDPALQNALLAFDRKVALFGVRCRSSLDFFRSQGLVKPQLLCDPAIFKRLIAPSAAGPTYLRGASAQLAIGINFAFHGKFVEQLLKRNLATYIAFLKNIADRYQPRFYYFIHSDEEFLIARLLCGAGIALEVVDVPADQLAHAYRQVDGLVCQMMHSNILSFCAGVPALNIAYDAKNFGFNELIEMQDWCISAYELDSDSLTERMSALIENRGQLARAMAMKKQELGQVMKLFQNKVSGLIFESIDGGRVAADHRLKIEKNDMSSARGM